MLKLNDLGLSSMFIIFSSEQHYCHTITANHKEHYIEAVQGYIEVVFMFGVVMFFVFMIKANDFFGHCKLNGSKSHNITNHFIKICS